MLAVLWVTSVLTAEQAGTSGEVQVLLDHVIHKRGLFLFLARGQCI